MLLLQRKPMPLNHGLEINTNNLREYEPYRDDGEIVMIDSSWWETVNDVAKQKILEKIAPIFTSVPTPHDIPNPIKTPREKFIYESLIDSYDYQYWCSARTEPYRLYKIPEYIKKHLVSCNMTGRKPHPDIVEWLPELPWESCFARLSGTSGKNEFPVFNISTHEELLTYLTQGNSILVKREFSVQKDTYLILIPWKEIPHRLEFRVFFRDNKVIGASQQFTGTLFNYTQEELDELTECFRNLSFPDVPYREWTADVYWVPDEKTCRLIECNPYGAHTGAGSALFEWDRDHDMFEEKSSPEFRYLSVINY